MLLIPPSPTILLCMPSSQAVSWCYRSSSLSLLMSMGRASFDCSQTVIIVTLLSYLSYVTNICSTLWIITCNGAWLCLWILLSLPCLTLKKGESSCGNSNSQPHLHFASSAIGYRNRWLVVVGIVLQELRCLSKK